MEHVTDRSLPRHSETCRVVLPDTATCPACLAELFDARNRRHGYPFISCARCGPRFAVVLRLPLMRHNTAFAHFARCARCAKEAAEERGRRFEAIADCCPDCGPVVQLRSSAWSVDARGAEALARAIERLRSGDVLAVKAPGGWRLIADARNPAARARLSGRRPAPPLPCIASSLAALDEDWLVSDTERGALGMPSAPLVRLRSRLAGAPPTPLRLPWWPLEHWLAAAVDGPLLCPVGIGGAGPPETDDARARARFAGVADAFLSHDLPLPRPVPDAELGEADGAMRVLRAGRGHAPLEFTRRSLRSPAAAVGCGSDAAASIAVTSERVVWLGAEFGDVARLDVHRAQREAFIDLALLAAAAPRRIVIDAAMESDPPCVEEFAGAAIEVCPHAEAHLWSALAERPALGDVLGVVWDGDHGAAGDAPSGGEYLRLDASGVRLAARLRAFRVPGGARAAGEPRRVALGLLHEFLGRKLFSVDWLEPVRAWSPAERARVARILDRGFNAPRTSSVRLLVEALASLMGVSQLGGYPGAAFDLLDDVCDPTVKSPTYEIAVLVGAEPWLTIDWEPAVREVVRDASRGFEPSRIAGAFFRALARTVPDVARRTGAQTVALAGSAFESRHLTECVAASVRSAGLDLLLPRRVPPGEGGLALGQASRPAAGKELPL